MGFKSFVANTGGMIKQGATKAWGGMKKGYNIVVNEWAPKVHQWIEDKVGAETMNKLAKGAAKITSGLVAQIPIVGQMISPWIYDKTKEKLESSSEPSEPSKRQKHSSRERQSSNVTATKAKSGRMRLNTIDTANNWHSGNRFGNPSIYGGNGG